MFKKKLHLHSMMVHAIVALAPLAAVAYVFMTQNITVMSFAGETWSFLIWFSVAMMFLFSLPSTLTGIYERNHIYAKWHSTHKAKLVFTAVLLAALVAELALLFTSGLADAQLTDPLGILIIVVNNIACFALGFYGLKISIGRQGIGKTSYEPDLFKSEPYDILVECAEQAAVEPDVIDLYDEESR